MDLVSTKLTEWWTFYNDIWERRDKRMDEYPLMGSPLYTIFMCAAYVYAVKVAGPKFMKDRNPYDIKRFMVFYNAAQVIVSGYIFIQVGI